MNAMKNAVAPDGGWGWAIMFAYIVNNILIIPLQQNFGLLFKDKFEDLQLSGTHVTSIISTSTALSELLGLVTGPLLKRFSIRSVAVGGSILFSIGVTTLTFATNYLAFMISYGILTALGIGAIRLTTRLSLNMYFVIRRRKVVGVALALRSLGSIFFPQLIVLLLVYYSIPSAILIIGGLCFHTVCMSLLLRPVEWYVKETSRDEPELDTKKDAEIGLLNSEEKDSGESIRADKTCCIPRRMSDYYDISLFRNKLFLRISLGMMFSVFADSSFSTLFPLILSDLGFRNAEIALFVSISYISNVIVRFTVPFIGDYFRKSSRFMYCLSCYMVITGRFAIMYFSKTTSTFVIPVLWGVTKGIRTVYWNVIIADNIQPEQLASAESIHIVLNGFAFLIGGPLLGLLKDGTGSYVSCVYVLNMLTFVTCLMWSTEGIYNLISKRRTQMKHLPQ